MQIATLSAQPRRRAPRFSVSPARERLRLELDASTASQRERLENALSRLVLAGSLEWVPSGAELSARSPRVTVSTSGHIETELELCASNTESERASALVFEVVQALAEASFGVHVTFSEKRAQRQATGGRKALP